jgi:hypothetical protein
MKQWSQHRAGCSPALVVASLCLFLLTSMLSMMSAAKPNHPEDVGVSARHFINFHPAFAGPPKPLDHDSVGSAIFDPPWRGGDWPLVAEIRPTCDLTGRRAACAFQARGPPLV